MPSVCGGELQSCDDWALPGVFMNRWMGPYGVVSLKYGIIAME